MPWTELLSRYPLRQESQKQIPTRGQQQHMVVGLSLARDATERTLAHDHPTFDIRGYVQSTLCQGEQDRHCHVSLH
jgi:hypothetical protein